jgi:predicted GIY-YIG superfamily endonuclease
MRDGGYVYILASGRSDTLHIGVTGDVDRPMQEHREGAAPAFAGLVSA